MGDFLTFRKLITTQVIQVFFWIGSIALVIAAIAAIANDQAVEGVLLLVFGGLYFRILCEVLIVVFRMHDTLAGIKRDTAALPALGGGVGTPASRDVPIPAPAPDVSSVSPAAGWYEDPDRPGRKRWWEGSAWGARDDEQSPGS
jgi:Domain of unknown function (DUF4282)/Protein of unknown function (DUF2510)